MTSFFSRNRYLHARYLALALSLTTLLVAPEARAQAACEQDLAQAQEAYTFGRFDAAIQRLDRCLDRAQVTDVERQRAHRLLALSYLGKDEPDQARLHVRELLVLDPDYRPDEAQDPPPFIQMIAEVRRTLPEDPEPPAEDRERGGISKWVWIGGGAALAAVAAAVLLSGGGDDDDDGGGNGEEPTTLDEQEPNNTPAQAQVIRGNPPVTVRGSAQLSDFDPGTGFGLLDDFGNIIDGFEDLYRVTISQPGLQITLSGLSSDGDIHLVDLNNLILAQSINAGTSSESINFSGGAGTYLIAVSISDDAVQQGLPSSTAYTLVVNGAVSGSALPKVQQRLREPGGAGLPASFRLVAHPGGALPLREALNGPGAARWTAFREQGTHLAEYDGTDVFTFRPGQGFWVEGDAPPGRTTDVTPPLDPEDLTRIPLQPGWNIIANPREAPLDWAHVQAANGVSQVLWRWDGQFVPASTFEPARRGEAYYFLNTTGREALTLPPPGRARPSPAERSGPALTLAAYREGRRAAAVQVGLQAGASVGMDRYDQPAPPGYFEAAHLRLVQPVSGERRLELAHEFRPPDARGQRFDLLLEAPPHQPITLRSEGLDAFAGYVVSLVDLERAVVYDLRRQPVVTLTSSTAPRRLQLVIGSDDFLAEVRGELRPDALELDNYPNPFNPQTTLAYTVPREDGVVRLEVFDVAGRRVRLLVEGRQEPGSYEVTWDGRDATGAPVATGLYVARLRVGERVQVRRMLLTK